MSSPSVLSSLSFLSFFSISIGGDSHYLRHILTSNERRGPLPRPPPHYHSFSGTVRGNVLSEPRGFLEFIHQKQSNKSFQQVLFNTESSPPNQVTITSPTIRQSFNMCIAYHVRYRCGHNVAYGNLMECDAAKQYMNLAALDPPPGDYALTVGDIIMQAGMIHRVTQADIDRANKNAQPVTMPANALPPNAPPGRVIPVGSQAVPGTGIPCKLVNMPYGPMLRARCPDCKEKAVNAKRGWRRKLAKWWPF
ncbi:hypothetical protein DFH27DRAFT_381458 [Peziza echinospora]|nr:hypothetical protein DFH27DRAFT_381458 [Peziza echinospora]